MKAYPFQHKNPTSGLTTASEGMELRDWFAGMALQGLIVRNRTGEDSVICSYILADLMMKQRKEVPNE
jgi:hypothetical protein